MFKRRGSFKRRGFRKSSRGFRRGRRGKPQYVKVSRGGIRL